MKKNKKKSAFTLAEMLLVLGVLGILMVLSVTIMNPQQAKRKALISSALTSLDTGLYNGISFTEDTTKNPFRETIPSTTSGSKLLCEALTKYLNVTSAGNHCDSASAMPLPTSSVGDANFAQGTRDTYLQFITPTGFHVFISERMGIAPELTEEEKKDPTKKKDDDHYFYLIYVDINGDKMPNTTNANKNPDIYVFAAISLSRVIPLGILETDEKLLTARMNYMVDNDGNIVTKGGSTSYAKAKSRAWGFYTSKVTIDEEVVVEDDDGEEEDGDGEEEKPTTTIVKAPVETNIYTRITSYKDSTPMLEEPYAYNDSITSYLNKNYAKDGVSLPFLKSISTNTEDFDCGEVGATDFYYNGSCGIEIDTYSY